MECLGFFIDDQGIHMDPTKMEKIRNWRMPCSYLDILRFNGVVQYLTQFLPQAVDFTAPPTGMCSNNNKDFVWTNLQEKCFNKIKAIVEKALILKPIDGRNKVPIWVLMDMSTSGIGAWYRQGPIWDTCRPTGFLSHKFTLAQMNYCTWEQELLGVLEALLWWEDKLMGLKFTIVMDHQALTFFNETVMKSQQRMQWWEYLSRWWASYAPRRIGHHRIIAKNIRRAPWQVSRHRTCYLRNTTTNILLQDSTIVYYHVQE